MALSGNVIPLKATPNPQELLPDLCDQLNLLTEEYILPLIPSLFPYLLNKLDEYIETATNNQDIMRLMDSRNSLKKNAAAIEDQLRSQLTMIHSSDSSDEVEDIPLALLDNDALNHKLLWISASEKMRTEDNLRLLFSLKKRFEQAFPEFDDSMPASPEKLCSSFSNVLSVLTSDHDVEQKILDWFTIHIQSEADKLWIAVNTLINEAGLAEVEDDTNKVPDKCSEPDVQPGTINTTPGSNDSGYYPYQKDGVSDSSSDNILSRLPSSMDSQLMDALAESLVLRVEDMLVQDEIIPEAKMDRIRPIDLATVLNRLQSEVSQQHLSIINLTKSIQAALEDHKGSNKLSRRHEDLINIVGLLFEYILDDHLLPKAVKKEIALLQIPILKLAIFENEFLSNREHPARILLNEMTSAGMSCQKDASLTDPIFSLIENTVRTIITESQEDLCVFKRSLESFRIEIVLIFHSEEIENEEIILTSEKGDAKENVAEQEVFEEEILVRDEADISISGSESELMFNLDETEYEEEIILEREPGKNERALLLDAQESSQEEANNFDYEALSDPEPKESISRQFVTVTEIRPGQWVEFVGEGESHRMRCKLAKVHKETNRYFFENKSGMRVAEYTGFQLQKEIDQGGILVLEDHQIFDRALQAVMDKFKAK
ncbi:hypothetical protein ACH42_05090 [Endozoicomonas sp. (ex Bugula neritina AB1)]|nr:hypothetical protein ACH42_05090 [Endozoicomonas sp. (ex Bugula neritina AB1)]